jgi:hypothetical protein
MRPLNDIVAEAIRADGSDLSAKPWSSLTAEKKAGWLGDADRAIAALANEMSAALTMADAAAKFVDQCPENDAGTKYLNDGCGNHEFAALALAVRNFSEARSAHLQSFLTSKTQAACPMSDGLKVKIDLVGGVEGRSLYINDHRVAGPKPWGGGPIVKTWTADISHLRTALERAESAAIAKATGEQP